MPRQRRRRDLLEEILDAAERHGRASEPDHEVGDVQDALRLAWAAMTPAQREAVHRGYFRTHDSWLGEDLAP